MTNNTNSETRYVVTVSYKSVSAKSHTPFGGDKEAALQYGRDEANDFHCEYLTVTEINNKGMQDILNISGKYRHESIECR